MKANTPISFLVFLFLASAIIGAGSTYYLTEIIQLSHKTTYSLEEEIYLYDQIIEKANKNEIEQSDLIRIFASEKKRRIAAHNVMNSTQKLSKKVIATLIFIVIGQMVLVFLYMKKKDEE